MRTSGVRLASNVAMVLAALAILGMGLVLYVDYADDTLERISTDSMDVHADFDSFWRSAEAVWEGGDLYDAGARLVNLNPPFWTLFIAPLGLLKPLVAYRVFVLLSVLICLAYLAWMADELRMRVGWAVWGTGMLLLSSPLLATLALGQVYPVLALGLVAAWMADRRGNYVASGLALGLVIAIKPSLLPVILWPAVRRRWEMLGAAIASGAGATLAGLVLFSLDATLAWIQLLRNSGLSAYWDNASIPAAAARMFTENEFAEPIARLPWVVPMAYVVGICIVVFTAVRVRGGQETALWALVAASLLASPIAWHNYLVLLAPGVLLLLARGRVAPALLLLALQFIPPQWPLLWRGEDTVAATLALTLYLYILIAHWLAFLSGTEKPERSRAVVGEEPS